MINAFKYATKKMVESNGSSYLMANYVDMIEEIQKDAYNQAIDDAVSNVKIIERMNMQQGYAPFSESVVDKESLLKLKK